MTDELLPRQSDPQTDATALPGTLESLGFTFGEVSPATKPVDVPIDAASSAPAPLSRRALREAEKQSSSRRGGRSESRAAKQAARASASAASSGASPASSAVPMDPADIATAPLDAVNAVGGVIAVGGVNAVGGVEAIKESILSATVPSGTVGPEHPASSRGRRASTTGTVQRRSPAASPATRSASTARPVSLRRRVAQKSFPPVVMVAAAALLIGTSVPPSALFDPDAPPASAAYASIPTTDAESDDGAELVAAAELEEDQVLEMPVAENVAAPVATRDEWSVTSYADMLRLKYGTRNFSYSTTGEGAVRWPFPYAVPISSGFGDRVAPCWGCSSYHRGLDMTPGRGTPVYSVAEGVVTGVGPSSTYGYRVEIEHVINGQRVKSLYAHMEWDSSALVVGDEIPVGEFLGTVGNSGLSTGPHLHLEIHIDDIPIDPFAWLMTNAA